MFFNNSTKFIHKSDQIYTFTSLNPITDIMVSVRINKAKSISNIVIGLIDKKLDKGIIILKIDNFSSKSLSISSNGETCEKTLDKKITTSNKGLEFKQGDTITFIRDKKNIQILINGVPNVYNYSLDSEESLYLACTVSNKDDEIEILN